MPRTHGEIGDIYAKKVFDHRSRGKDQRNVEVHLSEHELSEILSHVAETARIGYIEDPKAPLMEGIGEALLRAQREADMADNPNHYRHIFATILPPDTTDDPICGSKLDEHWVGVHRVDGKIVRKPECPACNVRAEELRAQRKARTS